MVIDREYVAIDLKEILGAPSSNGPLSPLGCDLFIKQCDRYVLYREASVPFDWSERDRLQSSGVTSLWVKKPAGHDAQSQEHLRQLLAIPDQQLPPATKARLWYDAAKALAEKALSVLHLPSMLEAVNKLMGLTIDYLARATSAFSALLSAMFHDSTLHTHAVNVATYALGLGRFVGITSIHDLYNLGLGAFFHDIGKSKVPDEVLNKPGRLTETEWDLMRKHPSWGRSLLSSAVDLPKVALTVVEQHHERMDGSGYPYGLTDEKLHPFSKIVALADAYDAITSNRPHAAGRTTFEALSILKTETQGKLDPKLFFGLVHLLGEARVQPIPRLMRAF